MNDNTTIVRMEVTIEVDRADVLKCLAVLNRALQLIKDACKPFVESQHIVITNGDKVLS